jgi:hypothetical protein
VTTDDYVRQLEDACVILAGEMTFDQTRDLRAESPALLDFLRHVHETVEHEHAMVRRNVWADRQALDGYDMRSRGLGTADWVYDRTDRHYPSCTFWDGQLGSRCGKVLSSAQIYDGRCDQHPPEQ